MLYYDIFKKVNEWLIKNRFFFYIVEIEKKKYKYYFFVGIDNKN